MENLFINNLHNKDVNNFTTNFGLFLRRKGDKPFKKLCNIFTNADIIRENQMVYSTDEEYYNNLPNDYIDPSIHNLNKNKNNIIVERYPKLDENESYIFVCNHTCPEDIETVLNVLDRNAYLVLGSIESLKYNPEMYLSWLNGMIPFDIVNEEQRKNVFLKMKRVIKTNSILIFPEGSHNYNPNKIINNLFDGPVNLAIQENKKIVIVTLIKDKDNNVSYIDVGNPIDVGNTHIQIEDYYKNVAEQDKEKYYIKSLSLYLRDKMATSVYYIISRHFKVINRSKYGNIEEYFRKDSIKYAFEKLKWEHDVFDAEYLTKKTSEEKVHEEVISTISNLNVNPNILKKIGYFDKEYVLKKIDLDNKDIVNRMRIFWKENFEKDADFKKLIKKQKQKNI